MDDEGHILARAGITALVMAAVIVGSILVRNWLAFEVVAKVVEQPPYVFPTSEVKSPFMLTPWAMGTPWALGTPWLTTGLWDWSTPTPTLDGGVYLITPQR